MARRNGSLVRPTPPEPGTLPDVPEWVYSPERDRSFSEDRCFLCGTSLDATNGTEEHVFPKWLQEAFRLWDEKITLLNGTTIPYRRLTIPCCATCNQLVLGPIEKRMAAAHASGHRAMTEVEPTDWFIWLGKILYGFLFREMFLPVDRRDLSAGPVVDGELMARFGMHHLFLQAARGIVTWSDFPASIFLFESQESTVDVRRNFDFADSPALLVVGIRMGHTSVFAVLQDFGALTTLGLRKFEEASRISLAPLQYKEVFAVGVSAASHFNRTPKFIVAGTDTKIEVVVMPLAGFSGLPLFDPWDGDLYKQLLGFYVGLPANELGGDGQVITWLVDDDGKPRHMSIDAPGAIPPPPGEISTDVRWTDGASSTPGREQE
jgi:hypothetical protein